MAFTYQGLETPKAKKSPYKPLKIDKSLLKRLAFTIPYLYFQKAALPMELILLHSRRELL